MTAAGSNRGIGAVLAAVGEVKKSGAGWTARCPAHDDGTASLSINVGDDGKALLKCHAGCDLAGIVSALGLTMTDLFPADNPAPRTSPAPAGKRKEVAAYPYHDEHGTLLFEAVRFEPKDFRQRRPGDDGRKVWNLDGVRLVPYRLPELVAAVADGQTVYIVEGEKDADTLHSWGLAATCNPMGAGKWGKVADVAGAALRGAPVVILPDDDEPGRKHAQDIAARLAGIAASVKVLPHFAGSKDVTSWKESGGTRVKLEEFAGSAPIWPGPAAAAEEEPGEPQPHPWADLRVTFEHFATTQPDPPEWLVPGLLEVGSLGVVYGTPSSLKSMIVLDLAVAVASGGGWLPGIPGDYATSPRETPRRKVMWIDMDNGRKRSHERMHAFAVGHGVTAAAFSYYAFPPLDLANEESAALLFDLIRAEGADLVILDTFINATSIKNENDNAELRGPLLRLRKIVDALGCCILVIHHSNKAAQWGAAQKNMRGGSAIAGALDLGLEVTRQSPQGDLITITATKERSAPIPEFSARWTFAHNLVGALESCRFFGVEHSRGAKDDDVREEDRSEEIIELLRTGGATSAREVRKQVKGRGESVLETIKRLVMHGDILETPRKGKGGGVTLSLPAPPAAPPAPVDPGRVWEFLEKVGSRTLPKIAEHFETSEAAVQSALEKLGDGLPDGRKVTSKSGKAGRKYTAVALPEPRKEGGVNAPASA